VAEDKSGSPRGAGGAAAELTLGEYIAEARKRRGLSVEDVTAETRLPANYVRMLETDDYGAISDQLYLVPFLRRYATFLGLDAEEIASRFVREVQRAETTNVRMSEPIPMVKRTKPRRWRALVLAIVIVILLAVAALFGWERIETLRNALSPAAPPTPSATNPPAASAAPPAEQTQAPQAPAAGASEAPFATTITPAAPAAAPSTATHSLPEN
jgi:cytoskeleton protein RodZ